MTAERLKELIDGYLEGTSTAAEVAELSAWYEGFDAMPSIAETCTPPQLDAASDKMFAAITKAIDSDLPTPKESSDGCCTASDKRMYQ